MSTARFHGGHGACQHHVSSRQGQPLWRMTGDALGWPFLSSVLRSIIPPTWANVNDTMARNRPNGTKEGRAGDRKLQLSPRHRDTTKGSGRRSSKEMLRSRGRSAARTVARPLGLPHRPPRTPWATVSAAVDTPQRRQREAMGRGQGDDSRGK